MTIKHALLQSTVFHVYRALAASFRHVYVNEKTFDIFNPRPTPRIYAHWHEDDIGMVYPHRNLNLHLMISMSRDGDLLAYITRRFGYYPIRGSSSRGGAKGLIQMIREIREGASGIITVDGPRGPRHQAKDGVLLLSYKTGAPILPVGCYAPRRFVFRKSWSQTYLPFPFTPLIIGYGPDFISPPSRNDPAAFDAKRREVEESLVELHRILRKTAGDDAG